MYSIAPALDVGGFQTNIGTTFGAVLAIRGPTILGFLQSLKQKMNYSVAAAVVRAGQGNVTQKLWVSSTTLLNPKPYQTTV